MTQFSTAAMLVSLNVRAWSARREDKKISAEVARTHNTDADAGRYNKQLVAKGALDPITKAVTAIREYHYSVTLPWLDEGIRILPSAMFQEYKARTGELLDSFDSAVRDFESRWPEVKAEARERLNGMFQESDYPVDIGARFGCGMRFLPVPDSDDFRVNISDLERDKLRGEIADTLQAAQDAAMRDLWQRVADCVSAMAERLAAYKVTIVNGKPKAEGVFRDSLVENLRDLSALLPKLNFAGDARLDAIRSRIDSELLQHTAQELRDRQSTRETVAAQANEIASAMAEFMGEGSAA